MKLLGLSVIIITIFNLYSMEIQFDDPNYRLAPEPLYMFVNSPPYGRCSHTLGNIVCAACFPEMSVSHNDQERERNARYAGGCMTLGGAACIIFPLVGLWTSHIFGATACGCILCSFAAFTAGPPLIQSINGNCHGPE